MPKIISTLKLCAVFPILFLFVNSLYSQQTVLAFNRNSSVLVTNENNQVLDFPWTGGFNFCQVSEIDINGDNELDLFIFDRSGNRATFLEYHQGAYRLNTDADGFLPALSSFALMIDFNCDNRPDLFTFNNSGIRVFVQDGPAGSPPQWRLYADKLRTRAGSNTVDIYTIPVDIPAFNDIDNDGDLDILVFNLLGSCVEYHRNMAQENFNRCDTLAMKLETISWGRFSESFSTNEVTLNDTCAGFSGGRFAEPARHAGSTLTAFDSDGDGDKDLLLGDIAYRNLVKLINGGSSTQALITSQIPEFPETTEAVNIAIFPAAYMVDVDHDGLKDMVVSPNSKTGSENYRSFLYYKNIGNAEVANFSYQGNTLFSEETLDFGEGANVTFFDYNNDGKRDILVGNYGYFLPTGDYKPQVALLENTSTAEAISFRLVNRNFASAGNLSGVTANLHPTAGDLDNDGDADLLLGSSDGSIYYFENTAPAGAPANMTFVTASFQNIDVGTFAAPFLFDIDQDGRVDLFVGTREGSIQYYRNVSNGSSPAMELQAENWGGVNTALPGEPNGFCTPQLFRKSGVTYLIAGSQSGFFRLYANIDDNLSGPFTLLDSLVLGNRFGERTSIGLSDLNDDGYPEAIVGNYAGGISFLEGIFPSGWPQQQPSSNTKLFPNPGNTAPYIYIDASADCAITVFDVSARVLFQGQQRLPGNLPFIPETPGVYLVQIQQNNHTEVIRWSVQ